MTPELVADLLGEALMLVIILVSLMIIPALLVGLLISIFQAATQINEQTLSFLPRLLVTLAILMMAGPWILHRLIEFTENLMASVPTIIG